MPGELARPVRRCGPGKRTIGNDSTAPRSDPTPSPGWARYRWLSKDYEFLTATSEAVIYLAMTRLLLRRLTSR